MTMKEELARWFEFPTSVKTLFGEIEYFLHYETLSLAHSYYRSMMQAPAEDAGMIKRLKNLAKSPHIQ